MKIFRKIRLNFLNQGKTSKYLKYAIGEILLVVIGILIALQVNNWNETRIAQKKEKKIYSKILLDLDIALDNVTADFERFQEHQKMHAQLYKESRGLVDYDPNVNYHLLRLTRHYIPVITENYLNSMPMITNETVRAALNDYIKEEKMTLKGYEDFNNIKMEMVRPFTEKNGLMSADVVFHEVNPNWQNVRDTVNNLIRYDKLKELYGSQELDQILSSLWLNTGYPLYRSEVQMEQIKKLKICLEQAINE
ncbi:MAG: hypothetical protein KJO53_01870 [Eudoraea sp.]|nr:hypothetical protein [Eudoraea sp.]